MPNINPERTPVPHEDDLLSVLSIDIDSYHQDMGFAQGICYSPIHQNHCWFIPNDNNTRRFEVDPDRVTRWIHRFDSNHVPIHIGDFVKFQEHVYLLAMRTGAVVMYDLHSSGIVTLDCQAKIWQKMTGEPADSFCETMLTVLYNFYDPESAPVRLNPQIKRFFPRIIDDMAQYDYTNRLHPILYRTFFRNTEFVTPNIWKTPGEPNMYTMLSFNHNEQISVPADTVDICLHKTDLDGNLLFTRDILKDEPTGTLFTITDCGTCFKVADLDENLEFISDSTSLYDFYGSDLYTAPNIINCHKQTVN